MSQVARVRPRGRGPTLRARRHTLALHNAIYARRGGDGSFLGMWRTGVAPASPGPVHVSMNDFWVHRIVDVPRVALAGMRFWREWPRIEGAVGLWFAASSRGRRQISVSVWRSQDDLRRFVRSPDHLKVMRDFRGAGALHTNPWTSDALDASLIWEQAEDRLLGRIAGASHHDHAGPRPKVGRRALE